MKHPEERGQVGRIVDMGLGRDIVAHLDAAAGRAHLHHLAGHLVAHDLGQFLGADTALGPGIPFPDMDIGAADGGGPDLDQHPIRL